MQCTQRKAFMGLVALTLAAATPALAQDTTAAGRTPQPDSLTMPGQGGGADTSGYSGMERNDPTGARDPGARSDTTGEVETGAVRPEPSAEAAPPAAGETAGQSRDPNGFRWTEPSDFTGSGQAPPVGATDPVQPREAKDSLTLPGQGGGADTSGYSGMERDTAQSKHKDHKSDPSDSTKP
jgi:hypothetical protein